MNHFDYVNYYDDCGWGLYVDIENDNEQYHYNDEYKHEYENDKQSHLFMRIIPFMNNEIKENPIYWSDPKTIVEGFYNESIKKESINHDIFSIINYKLYIYCCYFNSIYIYIVV